MRMLSPQPVRTPGVFCQASVASWTLDKNFKDFQRPFESQFPPQEQEKKKKSAIEIKSAVPVSRPISTLSCDRISPSLLSLLWLDLCCLDTVHTAVRLGHSQAREESGVNGTRKTLFPKMYLFLNNLKWKEGFFFALTMRLDGVSNPVFYSTYGKVGKFNQACVSWSYVKVKTKTITM